MDLEKQISISIFFCLPNLLFLIKYPISQYDYYTTGRNRQEIPANSKLKQHKGELTELGQAAWADVWRTRRMPDDSGGRGLWAG